MTSDEKIELLEEIKNHLLELKIEYNDNYLWFDGFYHGVEAATNRIADLIVEEHRRTSSSSQPAPQAPKMETTTI